MCTTVHALLYIYEYNNNNTYGYLIYRRRCSITMSIIHADTKNTTWPQHIRFVRFIHIIIHILLLSIKRGGKNCLIFRPCCAYTAQSTCGGIFCHSASPRPHSQCANNSWVFLPRSISKVHSKNNDNKVYATYYS